MSTRETLGTVHGAEAPREAEYLSFLLVYLQIKDKVIFNSNILILFPIIYMFR